jgi:hypothetical protein
MTMPRSVHPSMSGKKLLAPPMLDGGPGKNATENARKLGSV